jgi:acyl-homoserine lactone acylase PvdQ
MMKESPLTPEKYSAHPYIYNASRTAPRHQRGEMMTELLDKANKVTVEQAMDITFNPQVYHAELWQQRLKQAWEKAPPSARTGDAGEVFRLIQSWNRRSDADSEGALAYFAFKKGLGPELARTVDPPADIKDDLLIDSLSKAAEWLRSNFNTLRVAYGTYFRVGREGGSKTWPVGGGSLSGGANNVAMATPRAISFSQVGKEMVGRGGQTMPTIVILTNPPVSYQVIPLGESDHKDSAHWDDQAEKLFSKSKAAPTYFMKRDELMRYVIARKSLSRSTAARVAR